MQRKLAHLILPFARYNQLAMGKAQRMQLALDF